MEKVYPLVRFSLPDGTYRDLLCHPEEFKTEAPGGEIVAKRVQVPLILSWSISVHKAQGQTLEKVSVDLRKCFEFAQVYVALSRCTTLAGLQVLNFDPVSEPNLLQLIQLTNISGKSRFMRESFNSTIILSALIPYWRNQIRKGQ